MLYGQSQYSNDEHLAAIAAKALKEVTYHIKWSSEWVIRLGDKPKESHERMLKAIDELWPFTGEFFIPAEYEKETLIGFDLPSLKQPWFKKVSAVLKVASLWSPNFGEVVFMQTSGKQGIQSEHMGYILAELQYLQGAYPGAES